jgi:hypothetical protein
VASGLFVRNRHVRRGVCEYPRQEVARIMREHADRIDQDGGLEGVCRDRDGKVVGMWRLVACGE